VVAAAPSPPANFRCASGAKKQSNDFGFYSLRDISYWLEKKSGSEAQVVRRIECLEDSRRNHGLRRMRQIVTDNLR
jgi:hypothetical protein